MNKQTADFRAASKTAGWVNWATHAVRRVLAGIFYRYQARRTAGIPETFNDTMLADIGLTRDQIDYGARSGRLPDKR